MVRKNTFLEVIPTPSAKQQRSRKAVSEPSWSRETTPERVHLGDGSTDSSGVSTPTLRTRDINAQYWQYPVWDYDQQGQDSQWGYGSGTPMYDPNQQQWMGNNQYDQYGYEQYMGEDGQEWDARRNGGVDLWANKKRKQRRQQGGSKVFVGGLSARTTDEALRAAFSKFGNVAHAAVLVDAQQRSRGFGYVTFAGEVPEGVSDFDHLIDGRMCGARLYNYSARRGA